MRTLTEAQNEGRPLLPWLVPTGTFGESGRAFAQRRLHIKLGTVYVMRAFTMGILCLRASISDRPNTGVEIEIPKRQKSFSQMIFLPERSAGETLPVSAGTTVTLCVCIPFCGQASAKLFSEVAYRADQQLPLAGSGLRCESTESSVMRLVECTVSETSHYQEEMLAGVDFDLIQGRFSNHIGVADRRGKHGWPIRYGSHHSAGIAYSFSHLIPCGIVRFSINRRLQWNPEEYHGAFVVKRWKTSNILEESANNRAVISIDWFDKLKMGWVEPSAVASDQRITADFVALNHFIGLLPGFLESSESNETGANSADQSEDRYPVLPSPVFAFFCLMAVFVGVPIFIFAEKYEIGWLVLPAMGAFIFGGRLLLGCMVLLWPK
jgi:hypothetical protein